MGYKSKVAIKCEEKAYKMLRKTFQKVGRFPDKMYKDENEYILYWEWIKWDTGFYDVATIEDTLNELDELKDIDNPESNGYGYKLVRIGESDNDIETRKNSWEIELYPVCKIDIHDGLKEIE